ncbi:hydroxyacylglutathione hydrolase [Synechocystis sp. PCC 7509]|uniref:hydroxyacylglutathione hydrolase n=1 Tax=Synechocystis sp. PCC 7509 TaxID=927677 RepID=UPI0002AC9E1A|nr:hydroxyacylglutathione hydrolase [Synechocystis sp. PCC 7509]
MQVIRIPVLTDNYIFLLCDRTKNIAAVVDPAIAEPVIEQLQQLDAKLVAIFNTHHHHDHVGGNQQLIKLFNDVVVYGGAEDRGRIPGQQVFLKEGDRVTFGDCTGQVFFVPGHTRAHIAYYFPPTATESGELFCGDTLFAGGCGRLFEGTPTQMLESLTKFQALPDDTRVWCAHEYTLNNLKFALTVDSTNPDLKTRFAAVQAVRSRNESTIPSNLGLEKRTNPFLRWNQPALQTAVNSSNPFQTFARLRGMKDRF